MSDTISLKAAAEEAGMHYMTVYRWVRTGRLDAVKVGGVWQVDPGDLAAVLAGDASAGEPTATGTSPRGSRPAATRRRLKARLLQGDEVGVWSIVEDALAQGADPVDVHLELLLPVMRSIGEDWAAGEATIAAEHQASEVAQRVVARLGPRFARRGQRRGVVVCGAAPGDLHGLPVQVATDLLRGASYHVISLGSDVPAASFAEAASGAEQPLAVVMAVTRDDNEDNVREAIQAIAAAAPEVPVIIGGSGVTAVTTSSLGTATTQSSLHDLVQTIEQLRG